MIMFVKENDRKEILDVSLRYNEKYDIKTTDFFKSVDSMTSKLMLDRKYIITILMSKLANVFDEGIYYDSNDNTFRKWSKFISYKSW